MKYDDLVRQIATREGVDPDYAMAIMDIESAGNPKAVSKTNAQGLFQLMPETAKEMGVEDSFDPEQNATGGIRYLKTQLENFGNPEDAAIAYNRGPGNARKWIESGRKYEELPEETKGYIKKLNDRYKSDQVSWDDFSKSDLFKSLDQDQQEYSRRKYFEEIVSPQIPKEQLFRARMLFDKDTAQSVFAKNEPKEPTVSDYGRVLMGGLADTGSAIAGLGEFIGELTGSEGIKNFMASGREMANNAKDYWMSDLSPAGRRDLEKKYFSKGEDAAWRDIDSVMFTLIGSAPSTILTLGPSGKAAQMAYKGVLAKGGTKAAAAGAAAKAATAVGAITEGTLGMGSSSASIADYIENLPSEELKKLDGYEKLKGLSDEEIRKGLIADARRWAAPLTGVTTASIAALAGPMEARLFTQAAGPLKGAVRGAAIEGLAQEAPQSAIETIVQNVATGRPTYENVPESALQGLVGGAGMGGVMGAAAAGVTQEQPSIEQPSIEQPSPGETTPEAPLEGELLGPEQVISEPTGVTITKAPLEGELLGGELGQGQVISEPTGTTITQEQPQLPSPEQPIEQMKSLEAPNKPPLESESLHDVAIRELSLPEGERRQEISITPIQERRKGERRVDEQLRQKVANMTPEEKYQAIYVDRMTGLYNRRAFESLPWRDYLTSIDVDSLKWVNDNMGHSAGDRVLTEVGKAISQVIGDSKTVDGYHISGDEYYIQADSMEDANRILDEANKILSSRVVEGNGIKKEGINLTWATSTHKDLADHLMEQKKQEKVARGERPARGEEPKGVTRGQTNAENVRSNQGQMYQEGRQLQRMQREGGKNLQQPKETRPAPGNEKEQITKESNKPPSSGSTLHSNPLGEIYKEYQKAVDWTGDVVNNAFGWYFTSLKKLPKKRKFRKIRGLVLGRITNIENITKRVYDTFTKASPEDSTAIFQYLTDRDSDINSIKSQNMRHMAKATKKLIWRVGKGLVDRGLLSEQAWRAHENAYLPRVYLRYILGESLYKGLNTGKKPSKQDWKKMRKDLPEDVRELILGEITDPAFLASRGLGVQMRDIVLLDFLSEISKEKEWVFPKTLVKWKGKNVTVQWLKNESKNIKEQAAYYTDEQRYRALAIAKQMDAIADPVLEEEHKIPEDYKQFPNTSRYGRLRGMWVRKEIYNDIIGSGTIINNDSSPAEMLLGYGGTLTKGNQLWKMSKVALNPPTQIRNIISNGVLLQLSGVGYHEMLPLMIRAANQIRTNGKYYRIAKKRGVMASTFANNELFRIERELLDYKARMERDSISPNISSLKNAAVIIGDMGGKAYQFSESFFKTMKIMHAMEKEGLSESDAALEAQKWLYDYSDIPGSVRYLRNAPVGVPFLTFYYKTFPRMIEVAMKYPHRFAPYVIFPYILAAMIAEENDVDKEDVEQLKESLPNWLRERGNVYIYPYKDEKGRWQPIDIGYFLPWSMFAEAGKEVSEGKIGDAWQTLGLLGGPFPDAIAAIKTGIDPFKKVEIFDKNDPPSKQVVDIFTYLYRLAAPTWLTDVGFAGKFYESLTDEVDPKTGDPKLTTNQAILRLFGINVYPVEPEKSRRKNISYMQYEIRETQRRMKEKLKDKNNSEQDRKKIREAYEPLIKEKMRLLEEYRKKSKIHPNLR